MNTTIRWKWFSWGIDVLIALLVIVAIAYREWEMAQVAMLLLILSELSEIRRKL